MPEQSRVSAVIPVLNNVKYMDEALESLRRQNYPSLEIVIVDDGSTDPGSIAFLEKLRDKDIQLFRQDHSGPAAARNRGVAESEGELLLFLDSDDFFEVDFLKEAIPRINESEKTGAVSSWARLFGAMNETKKYRGGDHLNFIIKNESVNAALVKRSVFEEIGGFDENLKEGLEDWDFWLNMTFKGYRVEVIPRVLFHYRISEHSRNREALKEHDRIREKIFLKYRDNFTENYPGILFNLLERKNEQHLQLLQKSWTNRIRNLFPF